MECDCNHGEFCSVCEPRLRCAGPEAVEDCCPECHADWKSAHYEGCSIAEREHTEGVEVREMRTMSDADHVYNRLEYQEKNLLWAIFDGNAATAASHAIQLVRVWREYMEHDEPMFMGQRARIRAALGMKPAGLTDAAPQRALHAHLVCARLKGEDPDPILEE